MAELILAENGIINLHKDKSDIVKQKFYTLNLDIADKFKANGGTFIIYTNLGSKSGKTGDVIKISSKYSSTGEAKVKVAYDPFFVKAKVGESITGSHMFLTGAGNIKITAVETKWDKNNGFAVVFTPKVTVTGKGWMITSLTASRMEEISQDYDEVSLGSSGKSNDGSFAVIVNETTKSVSDSAQIISMAWLQNTNNLQKRMGDLRGGAESNMAWARFQRSNDDLNTDRSANISGNLYQVGYDFLTNSDSSSKSYFGLSLDVFDGTQSFKIGGGDIKSTTVSAYFTKIYESGHYFDIIARYGKFDSDTSSYDASVDNAQLMKLDYAVNGFTLSGEYGYRWKFGRSGLYLELQAEVIYGYLSGAKATTSTNNIVDIDSTRHFVTRAGIALGQKLKNFNYYLRGSFYHDFAGSTAVTFEDASYKQDGAQNWWDVSLGGGWQMGDASYFYAELTKHFKDISNSVNFNLGFRFTL